MTESRSVARRTYLHPMRWTDIDGNGHVNNAMFVSYLEAGRIEFLRDLDEYAGGKAMAAVVRTEVDYRRQLTYARESIAIDTWTDRIGGSSFTLAQEVYRETDQGRVVYVEAKTTMVAIDPETSRAKPLSDASRATLEQFLAEPAAG